MNKKFNSRLNMFDATDHVLTTYAADWTTYAPMANAVEVFRGQRDAIIANKLAQQTDLKNIAINKRDLRRTMADVAIDVCGKVKGWCKDTGNTIGYGEMHITKTMIMNGTTTSAQTLCQSILDKANTMTAPERTTYNITNTEMTLPQNWINAYVAVKAAPRAAIAGRKSETDAFKKMFTDCTITLKESIDNLMRNFSGTQFFVDYFNARRIVEEATQKATMTVTVVSEYDGQPLAGVMISGTDGVVQFQEVTDNKGRIKRADIKPELWDLTCTLVNYTTVSTQTDIYPGDKDKVLVKMKPV